MEGLGVVVIVVGICDVDGESEDDVDDVVLSFE